MRSPSQADQAVLATVASRWPCDGGGDAWRTLIRRKRMHARHLSWRRIWPRRTSHWRAFRNSEASTSGRRARNHNRALALAPCGNAQVLRTSGFFAAQMGHFDARPCGHPPRHRARPARSPKPLTSLSRALYARPAAMRRRWRLSQKSSVLRPTLEGTPTGNAGSPITDSVISRARAPPRETKPEYWASQQCLAVIYDKLGRHADAEAELSKLEAAGRWRGVPVRHNLTRSGAIP